MSDKNNFEVALVKELCILCNREMDGPIVMNQRLIQSEAKKVKDLNGKVVGFAEDPCEECLENMCKAFLFIAFDEEKSDLTNIPEGFFRCGITIGLKKDSELVLEFIKQNYPKAFEKGFIFTPHLIMKEWGLISEEQLKEYEEKVKEKEN